MKKFLISLAVISLCIAVYARGTNDRFINALRDCSSFSDSGTVETDGIKVNSTKQILGWNGDKCTYRERLNLNGTNVNITCNFSKSQVSEIVSVADAYFLTLQYSGESADISSLDAVKNNPLAVVFNKYIQNPSVCTIGR